MSVDFCDLLCVVSLMVRASYPPRELVPCCLDRLMLYSLEHDNPILNYLIIAIECYNMH
jgi:hypothetical protein